jgi:hypothetical protein
MLEAAAGQRLQASCRQTHMSDPEKQCRSQKQHNKKRRSAVWTLSSQENHILLDLLTPCDSRSPLAPQRATFTKTTQPANL